MKEAAEGIGGHMMNLSAGALGDVALSATPTAPRRPPPTGQRDRGAVLYVYAPEKARRGDA